MDNKDRVKREIKLSPKGLTIQELADKTKLSRITISNILSGLQGEKLITVRIVGQCKLHYWGR